MHFIKFFTAISDDIFGAVAQLVHDSTSSRLVEESAWIANFYVYILKSSIDYTLYTGQTNNLKNRLKKHNLGQIISTKNKIPYNLVYFEEYDSRAEAMQREWELKKKWNTKRKLRLIENFDKVKVNEILGP